MDELANTSIKQEGWAGTKGDLQAVVRLVSRQMYLRLGDAEAHVRADFDDRLTQAQRDVEDARFVLEKKNSGVLAGYNQEEFARAEERLASVRDQLDDELARVREAFNVKVTWVEDGITRTRCSSPETALDDVDPRVARSVMLQVPGRYASGCASEIEVSFRRGWETGARVRGEDHTWVRGTRDQLVKELQKSRQHLQWLRREGFQLGAAFVIGAVWSSLVWATTGLDVAPKSAVAAITFVVATIGTWGLLAFATSEKRWPRFELVDQGRPPQRAVLVRNLAASLAFQVALGLALAVV